MPALARLETIQRAAVSSGADATRAFNDGVCWAGSGVGAADQHIAAIEEVVAARQHLMRAAADMLHPELQSAWHDVTHIGDVSEFVDAAAQAFKRICWAPVTTGDEEGSSEATVHDHDHAHHLHHHDHEDADSDVDDDSSNDEGTQDLKLLTLLCQACFGKRLFKLLFRTLDRVGGLELPPLLTWQQIAQAGRPPPELLLFATAEQLALVVVTTWTIAGMSLVDTCSDANAELAEVLQVDEAKLRGLILAGVSTVFEARLQALRRAIQTHMLARLVDTHLAAIKARLWRPEGRLMQRQFAAHAVSSNRVRSQQRRCSAASHLCSSSKPTSRALLRMCLRHTPASKRIRQCAKAKRALASRKSKTIRCRLAASRHAAAFNDSLQHAMAITAQHDARQRPAINGRSQQQAMQSGICSRCGAQCVRSTQVQCCSWQTTSHIG